jgi:hypothetical protein
MTTRTPLAALIETRMQQLALDRAALGLRLGYQNPAKAAVPHQNPLPFRGAVRTPASN